MTEPALKVALVGLNVSDYQSLALGYVRAWAQADRRLAGRIGFQTLDLDHALDPWWIAYRLLGLEPDVVGFSVTCWNARGVYDICAILRAARPEIVIILGGPEVTPIAEETLSENCAVDVVVRGEGEETFADLLHALVAGRPVWRVEGVTARRDGAVTSAPDRPLIQNLDSIPSPYLTGVLMPADGVSYIEGYRGCPHRCAYCFEGKGYGRIRHFSDARIAAEVECIAAVPGLRSFSFIDPIFNLTGERLRRLADILAPHVARGIRLHTVEVDIEHIDSEQAALLRRAGVASVETGPQSVGASALQACRRGFDAERFAAGVRACHEQDIVVECDLIVGLPGDTASDALEGIEFAIGLDPGIIQLSTLHVLPGTELWERADELGLRFMVRAPHEIVRTNEMDFRTLRDVELFGHAAATAYRARLVDETDGGALS